MARIQKFLAFVLILIPAGSVRGETVFHLVVQELGMETAKCVGLLLSDGLLLTNRSVVARGSQYLALDPVTGARLVAPIKSSEADSDLALLSVPSLGGEPVTVTLKRAVEGRRVYLLVPGRTRITAHCTLSSEARMSRSSIDSLPPLATGRPRRRSGVSEPGQVIGRFSTSADHVIGVDSVA